MKIWHVLTLNMTFWQWTGENVTAYEPKREIDQEGNEVWTSVMGLQVHVDKLFRKGVILVKCKASILGREWETTKKITHQNKSYQPPLYSSARNQYSSGR